jgi:hypothetical protein
LAFIELSSHVSRSEHFPQAAAIALPGRKAIDAFV